jgi:NAD(P)H-nitrite reductase large subunit
VVIELELRYRALRSPHKVKAAVPHERSSIGTPGPRPVGWAYSRRWPRGVGGGQPGRRPPPAPGYG